MLKFDDDYNDGELMVSSYPMILYKCGILLFPYILFNPIKVALTFKQLQYSPSVLPTKIPGEEPPTHISSETRSVEKRLLETENYLNNFPSLTGFPNLPVDSLGYIETGREKVIGTSVLEDGSLLSTVIVSSNGITTTRLSDLSVSSTLSVLSRQFGLEVLWRGLGSQMAFSTIKLVLKHILSSRIDVFLFETFLSLSDVAVSVCSEVLSSTAVSILLLPLETAKARYLIQSRIPTEKKYSNIFTCIYRMHIEEKGLFNCIYKSFGMSSFFFYLSSSLCCVAKPMLLEKFTRLILPNEGTSSIPLVMAILAAPFVLDLLQVLVFQPFYIARMRMLVQFRPPQFNTSSISFSMPFYYWSSSSYNNPLVVRKLSVVRPFIVDTFLSPNPYTTIWNTIHRMYREEGLSSLYAGYGYRFLTLAIQSASSLISLQYSDPEETL